MNSTNSLFSALSSVMLAVALGAAAARAGDEPVSFRRDIAPLLVDHCQACHGAEQSEGGYRIDSFDRLVAEGDSGEPGIVAGLPAASLLYARISATDPDQRMPPEQDALPASEVTLVRRWIKQGASYDAEDRSASLASLLSPRTYPDPPRDYPSTLPITALAFGPEGNELLAAGYSEITIWDPSNGRLLRRISQAPERIYSLQLCRGGKQVLAGGGIPGRLGEVRLFDLASGRLEAVLGAMSDTALDVAVSPDGRQVAVASADKNVYVYQLDDCRLVQTLSGHTDWVSSIAWSSDGKMLATASRDTTARVYEVGTGKSKITFSGHGQSVRGVVFASDDQRVYSSDSQGVLSLWKIADAGKEMDVANGPGEVFHMTATDKFVFVSAADLVRQYDQSSHEEIRTFDGQTDSALSVALDAIPERVASGGFDGQVHVWNISDGTTIVQFTAAPGYAHGAED